MSGVSGSIVVARGKIVTGRIGIASGLTPDVESTLIAGRTITDSPRKDRQERRVPTPRPIPAGLTPKELDIYLTRQAINRKLCDIRVNDSRPFGFITFFELSTVGVEVKEADKVVRVTKVADDRPFAAAGVRVGDVITAVNGKKPDGAEPLRRLLRDALAVGDAAVVVRRGDATETLKVSLPE